MKQNEQLTAMGGKVEALEDLIRTRLLTSAMTPAAALAPQPAAAPPPPASASGGLAGMFSFGGGAPAGNERPL